MLISYDVFFQSVKSYNIAHYDIMKKNYDMILQAIQKW